MASLAVLPLDQRLGASSKPGDSSSARQRRRRSTRKSEADKSTRVTLRERERDGLELNTLGDSGSPSGKEDFTRSGQYHIDGKETMNGRMASIASDSERLQMDSVLTMSQLNSTSRQRHTHRRKRANQSELADTQLSTADSGLEDSTDGVAFILQRKLKQLDLGESAKPKVFARRDRDKLLEPSPHSDAGHSSGVVTEQSEEDVSQARGRPDPLGSKGRPLPPPANQTQEGGDVEAPDRLQSDPNATPTNTDMLGITVHGTDELQASVLLTHPLVRVSIVDASVGGCGSLLKKSNPEKCVTSYYERGNPSVDYILPVLTQPFECRHHRAVKGTLQALWEETLTFNENLSYFTSNEDALIFFELLDFVTFGGGRSYTSRTQSERKPWYRIAWAFLRPAGRTCRTRIGKKIRLQLYKYQKEIFGQSTESTEVYGLWYKHYRSTYPSTLYVTLRGVPTGSPLVPPPEPSMRSLFPLQEERGSVTFEQMVQQQLTSKSFTGVTGPPPSTLMSASLRLPGQPCQVPTSHLCTLYPTPTGCSSLAFSHSGHLLAAGCADQDSLYPLVIYEVPSFKPVLVTVGHRGIIYQMCWSEEDQLLASASADGIVKLWSLGGGGGGSSPLASLPHPCYIYCVCFLTGPEWKGRHVLATGAYDGYIRIWSIVADDASTQILGEFHGHYGHVNCLVWSSKASMLYAGDSKGVLGAWHKKKETWMLNRKADVMNGQSLVSMSLHPNGRKLLLHSQKGKLAMLDLRIDHICCEYAGVDPSGLERCVSLLSPCGGLVFAGVPSGTVHVWNSDTGQPLHVYSDVPCTSAIGAMSYHPSEHMLALSSFGNCQPFVVLNHRMQPLPATQQGLLPGDLGTMTENVGVLEAQLKDSRRLNNLAISLERVSARTKS